MKFFLVLLLLSGLSYGGYIYYRQATLPTQKFSPPSSQGKLIIAQTSDKLSNLASVLGASIESTFINGKEILSGITGGASEPIINQLVSKTADTLKDLPQKEADKIKYEFCKGVVTNYESPKTPPSPSTSQ